MALGTWVRGMPMPSNRTGGVSVSIRLDVYRDGHGCLVCTQIPDLSHPVKDHTEMADALRRLWDRGMREGLRRSYFKT